MKSWISLWEMLRHKKLQTDIDWRIENLMDQVGSIARSRRYFTYHRNDNTSAGGKAGYEGEMKISIADAYAQLRMLMFACGYSYVEIASLGANRLEDAIKTRLPK